MQPSPSASVALRVIITRCQEVEIAWTFLRSFQRHPPKATGLDPLATNRELYANARHMEGFNVSARTNVKITDVTSESEEGETV